MAPDKAMFVGSVNMISLTGCPVDRDVVRLLGIINAPFIEPSRTLLLASSDEVMFTRVKAPEPERACRIAFET